MTTFGATVGGNLKVFFKITSFFTETFKFPPTVAPNVVIFAHIIAKILLYLKSIGSAQTVEFSRRTSCQSAIQNTVRPPLRTLLSRGWTDSRCTDRIYTLYS